MKYYLLTFKNTFDAIEAEKKLEKIFPVISVPTLRELSEHCGISLKIEEQYYKEVLNQMSNNDSLSKTSFYEILGVGKNKTITFIR